MRYNHFDMLPERAFRKVGGRITLEGGGGGGGQQQTSTAYQTNIPEYLRGPAERMVSRGETLSEQAYQPYTGERIAGFSPAQQAAFAEIGGLTTPTQFAQGTQSVQGAQQYGALGANRAMAFDPAKFQYFQMNQPKDVSAREVTGTSYKALGAEAAPDVTGTNYTAERAGYTPEWNERAATQYMNPYTQAVTDIAKREAVYDAANLNKQLAGQAAKAGAFGGSRFGIEQALLGSKLGTNLSDIQTRGLETAYNQGLSQFNTEQAQRQAINLANQAAGNQAGQFGASQAQQANLANQQVRQQANLASQAAYNRALEFGATQDQAAQLANQAAFLTAAQANQNIAYQTGAQNLQANLTVQQQQEAARQNAANIQLQGASLGAQTGLQAASALQGLGTASQSADLQRLSAQQSAGAQQQALEQQKLDAAYQQAIEQRDWEKNQLGWLSGLVRGTPYSTNQLQTVSAPGASTASQLASLGLGAYGLSSLLGKKEGGEIKGYAKGGSVEGYAYGGAIAALQGLPDKVIQAAAQGKSADIPADLAQQELRRRASLRTAVQGKRAEEELAAGIGGLEADNMEFAADGGIMGYADGGDVARFDAGGTITIGGVTYEVDPRTGKPLVNGVPTDPKFIAQSAGSPWASKSKPSTDYSQSTKDWLGAQDVTRDKQYFADQTTMRENIADGKGINWKGGYYPIIQEGPNAGKVDYKGVATSMSMFPGAAGAVPEMPTSTPWKSTSPAATLAQAEAPAAAPKADDRKKLQDETPRLTQREATPPGSKGAGNVVNTLTANSADPFDRLLENSERVRAKMATSEKDPFTELKAAMEEQRAAYKDMRSEGRGLAALQAAAAISQGGPGGTVAQLGRGLGALGEAGFKLQNQLAAARQADMASRVAMAQAEEARNRGLRTEANQLAANAEQYGLQAAKLKQDYDLKMQELGVMRANAGRNTTLETLRAVAGDPKLASAYQLMHGYQGRQVTPETINKSYNDGGKFAINPVTNKRYTLDEWAKYQMDVYGGNMAASPSGLPSAADIAAEKKRRGIS